jgi:hypothetical protein
MYLHSSIQNPSAGSINSTNRTTPVPLSQLSWYLVGTLLPRDPQWEIQTGPVRQRLTCIHFCYFNLQSRDLSHDLMGQSCGPLGLIVHAGHGRSYPLNSTTTLELCFHSSIHGVQSAGSINRTKPVPLLGHYWTMLVPGQNTATTGPTMRTYTP